MMSLTSLSQQVSLYLRSQECLPWRRDLEPPKSKHARYGRIASPKADIDHSFFTTGWVPGNLANVFVTNHDTERVSLTSYLIQWTLFNAQIRAGTRSMIIPPPTHTSLPRSFPLLIRMAHQPFYQVIVGSRTRMPVLRMEVRMPGFGLAPESRSP